MTWKPLTEAAKEIGVSFSKISRLVRQGRVPSRKDPRDERLTLVDMEALRKIFPPKEQ
jgi:hypothetical protein